LAQEDPGLPQDAGQEQIEAVLDELRHRILSAVALLGLGESTLLALALGPLVQPLEDAS
jgi:hypothetical protein